MRFGAALDLWHKGDLHVEDKTDPEKIKEAEWAESHAMSIRSLMEKKDVEGATKTINGLGVNGEYDGDAKELVWGRLESTIRSTIKSYENIVAAKDLPSLTIAFEVAPKHAKDALKPYATKRKGELQPEQAEAE
jgi:hypothetical protein